MLGRFGEDWWIISVDETQVEVADGDDGVATCAKNNGEGFVIMAVNVVRPVMWVLERVFAAVGWIMTYSTVSFSGMWGILSPWYEVGFGLTWATLLWSYWRKAMLVPSLCASMTKSQLSIWRGVHSQAE